MVIQWDGGCNIRNILIVNYDVIIVGGGIIGFSTAYQLLKRSSNLKVAIIEKETTASFHQTGHNSGVIHAGVYYPPGSLKANFCLEGNRATKQFCLEKDISFKQIGKLIVATDELELQRMNVLIDQCQKNGLNYNVLTESETKAKQPEINALGSIFVGDTGIVNWRQVTQKYAECFKQLGGDIYYNQEVISIDESNHVVTIKTKTHEKYECNYLITCAGLHADRVVKLSKLAPEFKIIPFRGEYYKLPDKYSQVFKQMVYPVPDPALPFLGVHFTPQIEGFTTVGPNAVLALSREAYSWSQLNIKDAAEIFTFMPTWKLLKRHWSSTLIELYSSLSKAYYLKRAQKYFPNLKKSDLISYPAGVRAQAVDFQGNFINDFLFVNTLRILHTCNAPSPAATSSLPIGMHIINTFIKQCDIKGV